MDGETFTTRAANIFSSRAEAMNPSFFGIRHHGPGSARALLCALEELDPDLLLIEGPPEAESLIGLANDPRVVPPVALLHYVEGSPERHLYSPYAEYSPEWQAIGFGLRRGATIRMIDLPLRYQLAPGVEAEGRVTDPLAELAKIAGFDDPEEWWDRLVEERPVETGAETGAIWAGITAAMSEVRSGLREPLAPEELRREAWMRRMVRASLPAGSVPGGGSRRVAVICGAWHLPALDPAGIHFRDEAEDDRLLAGLPAIGPDIRVNSVWVPWSEARLSAASGYGAGIVAPGWSHHLWTQPEGSAIGWLGKVAALLRAEHYEVSTAQVIDAARLADALAAIRSLARPGLTELNEATLAVICEGREEPFRLIRQRLVIGERVGSLPPDATAPPLLLDWKRQCRELRLDPRPGVRTLRLDLRRRLDLCRSHLLHRLELLGVGGAIREPQREPGNRRGNFRETWRLIGGQEISLALNHAVLHGLTIESAAITVATKLVDQAGSLRELIDLLERVLKAGLTDQRLTERLTGELDRLTVSEPGPLLVAFPVLVRIERYRTLSTLPDPLPPIGIILDRAVERLCVGLPAFLSGRVGDDVQSLIEVDLAMGILSSEGGKSRCSLWPAALRQLLDLIDLNPQIAGCACLLLWQAQQLSAEEFDRQLSRALSAATDPRDTAAWIEGLLAYSGSRLIFDERLLPALDRWLCGIDAEHFQRILPILRRTFAGFSPAERRQIDERLTAQMTSPGERIDGARAALVRPILDRMLGPDQMAGQNGQTANTHI